LKKTNVLLNSTIRHEIGHFYHKRWEEDKYPEIKNKHNKELREYYKDINPNDFFIAYDKTYEGLEMLSGMYRDIISDIYGYFLFGPSIYRIRILMKYLFKEDRGMKEFLVENTESFAC
jgi:hypothetical protein